MGEGSGKAKESSLNEISPGDDFGGVAVKANGVRLGVPAAAHDSAVPGMIPQIGDLDDGGVYVGLSAEDGKPLHTGLKDLTEYKTYEEALASAEQLKSLHPTAHVPTTKELDTNLFDNRFAGHLKGTFNTGGSFPSSVYRSCVDCNLGTARVQWFGDGRQDYAYKHHRLPVRLVW